MLRMKKFQALVETFLWLAAVILIICTVMPVGAILSLLGAALSFVHINFVSDIASRIMNAVISFVKFVTARIRLRTREIESLRACSTVN